MRYFLNPKWILLFNTLPIFILLLLFYGQYSRISAALDEESITIWKGYVWTLILLSVINLGYAILLIRMKKRVSLWYGIIALIVYVAYLYSWSMNVDKFLPRNLPNWMFSDSLFLYVGTFLMPNFIYSILILILHFTKNPHNQNALNNLMVALGIPIAGFLFFQIIFPFWQAVEFEFDVHLFLILGITGIIFFLFFLFRSIYILLSKKSKNWKKYSVVWKYPIAIILPLIGLLVNNEYLSNNDNSGVFGDFNNVWFYILLIINGVLICLPNTENVKLRFLLFIGRCITFIYTLYFFFVFLPFLPISFFLIIIFGSGILILVPVVLFIVHTNLLSEDYRFLRKQFSAKILNSAGLISFTIIPLIITILFLKDRRVLHETLDYLYSPDYSKNYSINKKTLEPILTNIEINNEQNQDFVFNNTIPYLTSYYNWLVLDNLSLSDQKIQMIKTVFYNDTIKTSVSRDWKNEKVKLTDLQSNSVYDPKQDSWKSWIDMEITNFNESSVFAEYLTTINLPEGCWISDYYLYVGDRKDYGLLTEKKSALWIYYSIKNENKDPGILYYLTGNRIAFRVFPFSKGEVRKTGIEFIHKEPITLTIDDRTIQLGEELNTSSEIIETDNVVFIPSKKKKSLPKVLRKPTLHFIVDISENNESLQSDFSERIDKILTNYSSISDDSKISFVNSSVSTFEMTNDWKELMKAQQYKDGFFLERAIEKILFNAYFDGSYPVIIVVTDDLQQAVLEKNFSNLKFAFPENDFFYNLDKEGVLRPHSLIYNSKNEVNNTEFCVTCDSTIVFKDSQNRIYYLPDNNRASIVLINDKFQIADSMIIEKNWQTGLILDGKNRANYLHPELAKNEWTDMVRYSFMSKIMTPLTSYIVVETELQKTILLQKQEQVLKGNKNLDLDNDSQSMSEPATWIIVGGFGLLLLYRNRRKFF